MKKEDLNITVKNLDGSTTDDVIITDELYNATAKMILDMILKKKEESKGR